MQQSFSRSQLVSLMIESPIVCDVTTRDCSWLSKCLAERRIEINQDLCLSFVDWEKFLTEYTAVDYWSLWAALKWTGKTEDQQTSLYVGQMAVVRVNNALSEPSKIGKRIIITHSSQSTSGRRHLVKQFAMCSPACSGEYMVNGKTFSFVLLCCSTKNRKCFRDNTVALK